MQRGAPRGWFALSGALRVATASRMHDPSADRRGTDRRRGDRRAARGRRSDDSLLDAIDGGGATTAADSHFDAGWLAAGEGPADSRFLSRQNRRIVQAQDSALARIYRTYSAARAAIGVGLVATQGLGSLLGTRSGEWLALVSTLYAVQAITLWLLPRFAPLTQPLGKAQARQRRRQWFATIGVDLLAFSLLHLLEVGSSFNYAALLVLPVLMAGVLTPRLLALGTAAGVALLLLLGAWRASLGGADATLLMLQSGLAGLGMFAITLLAAELAGRLAREEIAARGSLELARQQAQLNRLVIEEMADGVLVIDRKLGVRAANPAARALLVDQGLGPSAPFTLGDQPAWSALHQAAEQALAEGEWPDAGRDVTLPFVAGHARTLRMRVRFMRSRAPALRQGVDDTGGEPFAVLLLEDVRTLQARIRQEKLAAMGRVSAGIAHEIRNPLAAISQANALMMEDELVPGQRQLAEMVAANVERLKQLVDDVMELAPGAPQAVPIIDAASVVAAAAGDWARTAGILPAPNSRLRADLPLAPLGVAFDPEHLRRVLVNLLDNAQRHAGTAPGSIFLRLAARDASSVVLSVLSDGEVISPEVERRLFEPFFSTRSRGSGLGLYICRELCERYGALIDYRPRPAAERLQNEFIVRMRRAPPPVAADAPPLDPV